MRADQSARIAHRRRPPAFAPVTSLAILFLLFLASGHVIPGGLPNYQHREGKHENAKGRVLNTDVSPHPTHDKTCQGECAKYQPHSQDYNEAAGALRRLPVNGSFRKHTFERAGGWARTERRSTLDAEMG